MLWLRAMALVLVTALLAATPDAGAFARQDGPRMGEGLSLSGVKPTLLLSLPAELREQTMSVTGFRPVLLASSIAEDFVFEHFQFHRDLEALPNEAPRIRRPALVGVVELRL
jgi:hypothetical protein